MNEILEIEIDGETEKHHGSERAGRAPAWGLPVAVALAGALVLAVLMTVVVPGFMADRRNAPPAMSPAPSPAPEAQAPPQDEDLVSLDPIDAADAALDAWARFAVTGDLTLLDGTFDPNGPQYQLLETEAGDLSASADAVPYEIELSNVSVDESKDLEAVVGATARWTRPGEVEQSFGWDLVLRLGSGDRWLLWTVRDRAPGAVPQPAPEPGFQLRAA